LVHGSFVIMDRVAGQPPGLREVPGGAAGDGDQAG
jgi:hypothetical protein